MAEGFVLSHVLALEDFEEQASRAVVTCTHHFPKPVSDVFIPPP